jgi:hypothetical protein
MTGSGRPSKSELRKHCTERSAVNGAIHPQYRTARSAHEIMVGDPAEAVERESRGLWARQDSGRWSVSVTCEKAGNEGPVVALNGLGRAACRGLLLEAKRTCPTGEPRSQFDPKATSSLDPRGIERSSTMNSPDIFCGRVNSCDRLS